MSATMQVKLLRVLQDRRFRRLGGTEEVQADIRVIAATNQDLQKMVAENRFREDLYYRINVIHLHLPPLRDRREDVPLLAEHFLAKYSEGIEKPVRSISHEALDVLSAHDWPGNVRELENAIERAVALEQTQVVLPESLPAQVRASRPRVSAPRTGLSASGPGGCQSSRRGSTSRRSERSSTGTTSPWLSKGPVECKREPRKCWECRSVRSGTTPRSSTCGKRQFLTTAVDTSCQSAEE